MEHKNTCIRAEGSHFTLEGRRIHLRGFGIGTWLNMEHFMMGIPTPDEMITQAVTEVAGEAEAGVMLQLFRTSFIDEHDFALMKENGVNFVRVPFNYRLFLDDNHPDRFRQEGFWHFDRLFELSRKYEIYVMPDLHTTPGGQNPDWHADNALGVPLFWKYQVFRKQMTCLWKKIAERYGSEPYLMGYDLLNEPAMADWDAVNEYYQETIEAIRSVDQEHLIILEGDKFSMDFSGLKHFDDPQIALGFHYYPTVWNQELLDPEMGRQLRRQLIQEGLERLLAIADIFQRPAFCGEFGYGADCGESSFTEELLTDTLEIMKEKEADWCLWSYKDAHFMSVISPSMEGEWMELVKELGRSWDQDTEKEQAQKILNLIAEDYFPGITEQERYLLQFRIRACLFLLQKDLIVKPALMRRKHVLMNLFADAFAFENCEIDRKKLTVIRSFLI